LLICEGIGVDLKRRPPKSLPAASPEELLLHEKAARKDPAVHVSLSSYSLVKQPGTVADPSPRFAGEPSKLRKPPTAIGGLGTLSVRSFEGASSLRGADGAP
jgi:hypothetical protein